MAKRTDIHSVLIIGAGPIVIGQACEFDYSGAQACKALREEGYKVILVNSNPATIMTDPDMADRTYVEPITPEIVTKIIEKERYAVPGGFALLPTMGGQTALNCALSLKKMGTLEKYDIEMIGATAEAIDKAEDRELFRDAMASKVSITPPPKAQLEEKLWMALFWMPTLREFWLRQLGDRGVESLRQWFPYTWILDPSPIPPNAVYPRLEIQDWKEMARFSQKERDLIIKISGFDGRAWGARGVRLGSDLSAKEWVVAIESALAEFSSHPHILQVFRHSVVTDQSYYGEEGALMTMKGKARLSPYFFVSENKATLGGVLATVCPADKKILHGMSVAVMTPVTASLDSATSDGR